MEISRSLFCIHISKFDYLNLQFYIRSRLVNIYLITLPKSHRSTLERSIYINAVSRVVSKILMHAQQNQVKENRKDGLVLHDFGIT